jgi:hypothetical protein
MNDCHEARAGHRPETRRNRSHFAVQKRRSFLSVGMLDDLGLDCAAQPTRGPQLRSVTLRAATAARARVARAGCPAPVLPRAARTHEGSDHSRQQKPRHSHEPGGFVLEYGLAVTYFRVRKRHTIIGANSLHGPVRDGRAWFKLLWPAAKKIEEVKFWIRKLSSE